MTGYGTQSACHLGAHDGGGQCGHTGMVIIARRHAGGGAAAGAGLWNDPASGVMRHADAGYDEAIACARDQAQAAEPRDA